MRLGEPCWKKENVAQAISLVAQLDKSRAHYFLASHSPIKFILDKRLGKNLAEEEFFQRLFRSAGREELALVQGEPGTGKSHLIYWLKLRCQSALETGEMENWVPVIIQRRTGSLKDALEQLIQQLPEHFRQYLNPVKEALGKISEGTARETLAGKLFLELGEAWIEKGHDPLPSYLKELREICTSQGFRQWLCRKGGVIDRNIKRLIESSDTEDREQLPAFTPEEFYIKDHGCMNQNLPAVRDLIDDFIEFVERREEAAIAFNSALPEAIKEMTGLSGTTLRTIFDQIRSDLKTMGKRLALFIEDISVMSALDEEIINAVEPQGRHELCPMIAVLGITEAGVSRLAENQKQRITCFVSVNGYAKDQWRTNTEEVARFAARYLNTVRLEEEVVQRIAQERKTGADVAISRCDGCPVMEECHNCFGKVEIEGQAIGMFPFTYEAPQRLLQHLDEQREGVRRNPRGLLMHVLERTLADDDSLRTGRFPEDNLPVSLPPLIYWQSFQEKFCGGWETREIARLNRLARGWIGANTAKEAASLLNPFLEPLEFREFSQKAEKRVKEREKEKGEPKTGEEDGFKNGETIVQPPPTEFTRLLKNLDEWLDGKELQHDQEPRQLLLGFVRESIPWDDDRSLPLSEWKDRFGPNRGIKSIQINGMRSLVAGFRLEFSRTQETHDLIDTLARFRYLGQRSWDFEGGETAKRSISLWLRRNQDKILQQLQPKEGLSTAAPVTCAVQFLATATLLRRRTRLPQDAVELVDEVLADTWTELPTTFDRDWQRLVKDMQFRHQKVRQFLFEELTVPQGRKGGINFIDPLPIIQEAARFLENPRIEVLGNEYFEGFWKSRYAEALNLPTTYADLPGHLKKERLALKEKVKKLVSILAQAGYDSNQPKEAAINYCKDLLQVVQAQRDTNLLIPDKVFDDMLKTKIFGERQAAWGEALEKGRAFANTGTMEEMLVYDLTPFAEALFAFEYADDYIKKVSKEVDTQLAIIEQEGDPDQLLDELNEQFKGIASRSETATSG